MVCDAKVKRLVVLFVAQVDEANRSDAQDQFADAFEFVTADVCLAVFTASFLKFIFQLFGELKDICLAFLVSNDVQFSEAEADLFEPELLLGQRLGIDFQIKVRHVQQDGGTEFRAVGDRKMFDANFGLAEFQMHCIEARSEPKL